MFKFTTTVLLIVSVLSAMAPVRTAPTIVPRHNGEDHSTSSATGSSLVSENALKAQQLNNKFTTLKASDSCQGNEQACVNGAFAQCVQGKWAVHAPCASGMRCYALPLVLKPGVALVCDTEEGADNRFQDAGASGGPRGTGAAPVEDDEEIEDCEEEDELEGRAFAEDDEYHYFYKRQLDVEPVTLGQIPASTPAPLSSPAAPRSSATPATAITSSSAAVATPTVVIGSDGIVTVTVVSTVFATPTGCSNPSAPAVSNFPTPITVTRATPIASSISPSSRVSSAGSARPTAFSSSAPVAESTAAPARPTGVNNGGGITFTTLVV